MDLSKYFDAIIDWFKTLWADFVEFMTDIPLMILDGLLSALATLLKAIPSPDFVGDGLGVLFNGIDSDVLYFVDLFNIEGAFALIAAGVAFRLARKILTLFQW